MAFFGLGLLGAAAHHAFSLAFQDDPKLATGAGAAYAAGILMQFAVNLLNCGGIAELIVLGAATIAISALSVVPQKAAESSSPAVNPFAESSHALAKQACWSIALVMILACLFSTLDNVVTLSNAHGTIAVQTWPRLFLAASGLAAGLIFDLAERRYMGLVMLGIAVLSTISILAVEAGADPNLGLVVFYLSSGIFCHVLYRHLYTAGTAHACTALWAGMGRAANNVCAFTTSGISLALVTSGNVALIMIGALMLLVAASVAFVAAGLFRLPQTEQEREREQLAEEALAAPTIEEQRQAFIANHALTPREVDVLIAVTQDERPLKQVAEELGISMRMVQRHLSSIYQKTDTQTRAGLTKAFPSA
mgnify:CR=1 FL=1